MLSRKPKRSEGSIECDPLLIGYARVSTTEQNLDLQVDALIRAGVCRDNIFQERMSGAALNRPELAAAIKQCRPGGTLVVTKLDRAGRSLFHLLTLLRGLDADGVGFRSLGDAIDTQTPIGKVVLAVLGAFAEFERDLTKQRTKIGMDAAIRNGVRMGPPIKVTDQVQAKFEAALCAGKTVKEASAIVGLAESTMRVHYPMARIDNVRARAKRKTK